MNDTLLLASIVLVLLLTGVTSALLQSEFSDSTTTYDVDGIQSDTAALVKAGDSTTIYTVFKIIGGIFIWTFGLVPAWLDLFLVMLRVFGYLILAKLIRGVGT